MSRFADRRRATELYRRAVSASEELGQKEGLDRAMRASAEGLAGPMRGALLEAKKCTVSKGVPCALRLVQRCQHDPGTGCEPPGADHSVLLLRDRRPYAFVTEPYSLDDKTLRQMLDYADNHDLQLSITGFSPHFPGRTVLVMMRKREG